MINSLEHDLKRWIGRLAFIPLVIYALGTPLALLGLGSVTLQPDPWLPAEIMGLIVCIILTVCWGLRD